jgi:membrane associated rhomboid family serine protease/antitoxin component YwqK of YwqJK toxin-antitoxin module
LIDNFLKILVRNWVTYSICLLNIIIFISYGFGEYDTLTLLESGANFAPYSLGNEPSRLLISMFLHGSLLHLLANMYSLYYVGTQVEYQIGSLSFLVLYLLAGFAANLTSLSFNLFIISVGASGAIFGIYGFLLVDTLKRDKSNRVATITNFLIYLVIVTALGTKLNFDNAAHFGGVAFGIILGLFRYMTKAFWPYFLASIVVLLAFIELPRHQVEYFKAYQNYLAADRQIIKLLNAGLSDNDFYDSLVDIQALPEAAISKFTNISHVPIELGKDTATILAYIRFRDRQMDFFLMGLARESFIFQDSIRWLGSQIENLPPIAYNLNFGRATALDTTNSGTNEELTIIKQYYDTSWFETDADNYEYYRVGQQDTLGDWHGWVLDHYKDDGIQMTGNFFRGLKSGIFIYYNTDSTYASAGRYYADRRVGKWEEFYKNGRLASEVRHQNGYGYLENLWEENGKPMVTNRKGAEVYYYPNGEIRYKRAIKDGLNHGFIESYYENGDLRYKELHENGELIKGVSYAEATENTYDVSVYIPFPEGGFESFYKYIQKENKLKSDSVDGNVVIAFDVHYTGRIFNIRFLKRLQKEYDDYAKELLLNGPKWNPARAHGIKEISAYAEISVGF